MNTESQDIAFQLNAFYRDNYRRTMKVLAVMIVICAILATVLAWITYDQKQPEYYAAMTTGEVIPMHALSEPVVTSDFIIQFSSLTARLIYNLSFATYQQQLDGVKPRFTSEGWEKMMSALNSGGLIQQMLGSKLIISSVISGPPVILSRLIIHGRFTWRIQMPMLVKYTSASEATQRRILVTMNVQRVPTLNVPNGVQIIDFSSSNAS